MMFTQRETSPHFLLGPKSLSYAELENSISYVANHLIQRQLANTRVLLVVRDDHTFAPLVLGCMRAGVVPLILDPRTVAQQVRDILSQTQIDGVIADADLIDSWHALDLPLPAQQLRVTEPVSKGLLLSKLLGKRAPADLESWPGLLSGPKPAACPPVRTDGVAYILFTSGSTSRPKGVEMSWQGLLSHLDTLERHYRLAADSRIMNLMPLSHSDGLVQGVLLSYRCGIPLVRPAPFSIVNIESILIAVYRDRVSHMVAAPTALALLQQYGGHLSENFASDSFRFVISCSAPLSKAVWNDFSQRFKVPIVNTYGLTETGACGLYAGPDAASHKVGSVGVPRDMEARIVKSDGAEAGCDETGELWLRGANLMQGYLNDAASTARALQNGWLHTGDLAQRDADGVYYIVGRIKDLIICGGYNLSPEAINAVLMQHPAILEAATVGMPDPIWGEIPVACVVLRPNTEVDAAQLLAHCRQYLSEHELPKRVEFAAQLPRTQSGKVIAATLQELLLNGAENSAVTGNVHEQVFSLAAEIFKLPVSQLHAHSGPANTPGWDSLAHINFVIGLEMTFGIRLSPSDVVQMETLDATIRQVNRHAA